MFIQISHEKGRVPVTVLSILGDIDSSNADQLDTAALQEIDKGAQYIVIDLAKVRFMSSAGFRALTKIFKKFRSISLDSSDEVMRKGINTGAYKSPNLKLCKPSETVAESLRLAGFDMLLEIHADLKKAIASF